MIALGTHQGGTLTTVSVAPLHRRERKGGKERRERGVGWGGERRRDKNEREREMDGICPTFSSSPHLINQNNGTSH